MQHKSFRNMPCPIARSLERVGEWWSMLIMRDALHGMTRFDQFQDSLGIAPNMLTRRLNALVEAELLERRRYSERPPRDEYVLTARGRDFRPVIVALLAWGNKHFAPEGASVLLIDARTGLAADPVMVDRKTGRPVEVPEKRPRLDVWAKDICPNLFGGKNWEPMAYNPQTGLVYIPTFNLCMDLVGRKEERKKGAFYLAEEFDLDKPGPGGFMSEMVAWDPISQKRVWGSKEELPFLGGALATGGGLVFHGNIQGWFKALDAKSGKLLWQFKTQSGIVGQPIAYRGPDGKEYIAVLSGVGGWAGAVVFDDIDTRDGSAAGGFANAMRDLKQRTAKGGMLYVFALP